MIRVLPVAKPGFHVERTWTGFGLLLPGQDLNGPVVPKGEGWEMEGCTCVTIGRDEERVQLLYTWFWRREVPDPPPGDVSRALDLLDPEKKSQ